MRPACRRRMRHRDTMSTSPLQIVVARIRRRRAGGSVRGWSCASALAACVLLLAACSETPSEAQAVADQFMRAYYVEDNITGAARLASGSAKAGLKGLLREIEAAGAREPVKDKPRVKMTLVETQPVSADVVAYVYRVDSETPGIEAITAKMQLSRRGNIWSVSEFSPESLNLDKALCRLGAAEAMASRFRGIKGLPLVRHPPDGFRLRGRRKARRGYRRRQGDRVSAS